MRLSKPKAFPSEKGDPLIGDDISIAGLTARTFNAHPTFRQTSVPLSTWQRLPMIK